MMPWLFVLPALSLITLVIAGPAVGTLLLSLTDWDGLTSPNFIGFENFKKLIEDRVFWSSLSNNAKWMLIFSTVPIITGLAIAIMVSKVKRGQRIYQTLFFLPNILSTVVTARIWLWIYDPFVGINTVFEKWGWESLSSFDYLGTPDSALYFVIVTEIWRYWGFLMVLFLVALHQLDPTIEEAARIEGANRLQIVWHVTLPQLRPTLVLIIMLTMIWSFTSFDYVFLMTSGGPGHATELLATYMYKEALYNNAAGYASAIALIMGVFTLLIIAGFGLLRKKGWEV